MMHEENLKSILSELKKLQLQIQLWSELPAIPEIEKDMALRSMQEIYSRLKTVGAAVNAITTPQINDPMAEIISSPKGDVPLKEEEIPALNAEAEKQQRSRANAFSKKEQSVTLFDAVSEKSAQPEETLLDKLSKKKEEKSLADKLSSAPVDDLKKSIGINERFKFINELFESSTAEYNQFIERLNACTSSGEALKLMEEEYAARLGWNKEEETYQSLTALIGRKFV
jgi:hypothetical protein